MAKVSTIYFKATLAVFAGLAAATAALCIYAMFSVSEHDERAYRRLVETANPVNSNVKASPYTAKQQRTNVQKDILLTQGADRLLVHLTSTDSVLVLDRQENKMEIIEKMDNVKCVMQEELFYVLPDGREVIRRSDGNLVLREAGDLIPDAEGMQPMQHVRYMEADHATYYYKNDNVIADHVKISRYTVSGHGLVTNFAFDKPSMTGLADNVEFSLKGPEVQFTAHRFKAIYYGQKGKL